MATGQLLVEFIASTAKYQEDLGKAAAQSEATARRIEKSLNGAFDSIRSKVLGLAATLGVGLSVAGFEEMIRGAIEAEAALGRIGARAGISGEEVSKLSRAARLSHTDLSDLADMSAKLSKALLASQESGSKQEAVLKALGFTSKDTARLLADPVGALLEMSRAINALPEGGTKAAVMLLLLGRGGAAAAAAMEELSKQTTLTAIRTNAEIAAAKELEDRLSDLSAKTTALKTDLANALVPTIDAVVSAFIKMTTGTTDARAGLKQLAEDGSIREWAKDAVIAVSTVVDALIFMGRLVGAFANSVLVVAADLRVAAAVAALSAGQGSASELMAAVAARNSQLGYATEEWEKLWNRRATIVEDAMRRELAAIGTAKEPVGFAGGSADAVQRRQEEAARKAKEIQDAIRDRNLAAHAGTVQDPSKKRFEVALREIDATIEEEKHILAARDEFLSAYYARSDISLRQFYEKRNEVITDGLVFLERATGQEIAKVQAFIDSREDLLRRGNKKDPGYASALKDVEDGNLKLIELNKRRTLAGQDAAKQTGLNWLAESAAVRAGVLSIEADLLELQGRLADAAKLRITDQARILRAQFVDYSDVVRQVDEAERLNKLRAEFNQIQTDSSQVYEKIGLEVARIDLLQRTAGLSELQTLALKSEAGKSYLNVLRTQAEAALVVARQSGVQAQIIAAEQLKLRLDELVASADVLKNKFDDIFTGSLATFFEDVIGRTKSLSQAVRDMAKSIEQSITKLVSEDLSKRLYKSLFGEGGAIGFSPGDWLAKLLGGSVAAKQVPGDAYLPGALGAGGPAVEAVSKAGAAASTTAGLGALGTAASTTAGLITAVGTSASTTAGLITAVDLPATTLAASLTAAALAADAFAASAAAAAGTSTASSAGNYASAIAAAVASGGSFASGGDPPVGRWSLVGERGPELFVPKVAGTIIPADVSERVVRLASDLAAVRVDPPSAVAADRPGPVRSEGAFNSVSDLLSRVFGGKAFPVERAVANDHLRAVVVSVPAASLAAARFGDLAAPSLPFGVREPGALSAEQFSLKVGVLLEPSGAAVASKLVIEDRRSLARTKNVFESIGESLSKLFDRSSVLSKVADVAERSALQSKVVDVVERTVSSRLVDIAEKAALPTRVVGIAERSALLPKVVDITAEKVASLRLADISEKVVPPLIVERAQAAFGSASPLAAVPALVAKLAPFERARVVFDRASTIVKDVVERTALLSIERARPTFVEKVALSPRVIEKIQAATPVSKVVDIAERVAPPSVVEKAQVAERAAIKAVEAVEKAAPLPIKMAVAFGPASAARVVDIVERAASSLRMIDVAERAALPPKVVDIERAALSSPPIEKVRQAMFGHALKVVDIIEKAALSPKVMGILERAALPLPVEKTQAAFGPALKVVDVAERTAPLLKVARAQAAFGSASVKVANLVEKAASLKVVGIEERAVQPIERASAAFGSAAAKVVITAEKAALLPRPIERALSLLVHRGVDARSDKRDALVASVRAAPTSPLPSPPPFMTISPLRRPELEVADVRVLNFPDLTSMVARNRLLGEDRIRGFAGGGDPPVGQWSLVGESGPELIRPRSAMNVVPNDALSAKRAPRSVVMHVGITVNVPEGTSRASADQIGLRVARALQGAAGNLG